MLVLLLFLLLSGDVELNPGPDGEYILICMVNNIPSHTLHFHYIGQQLDVNDLLNVMEELNIIRAKWYDVGMQLRVSVDTLDAIKRENQNYSSDCLRETLKTWLKTCPKSPTWKNIIDVLRSSVVGEVTLALDLEHKHCTAQDMSIPATTSTPPVPPPQQALSLMTPSPAGHDTQPLFTGFRYTAPSQPYSSCLPTWSPYYSHAHSASPHPSGTNSTATLPNTHLYSQLSQVLPATTQSTFFPPTLGPEQLTIPPVTPFSLLPIPITASPQYPALPSSHPFPISSNFVPADTPTSLATVTTITHSSQGMFFVYQFVICAREITCYNPVHTKFILGPTRIHTVEDRIQYFEDQFGNLADKAYHEVHKEMEPSAFLSRITYLPVSARTQHRGFVEKKLTNIPPPVAFENIWAILNLYWDFLNYGLLEHVINKCGSEDLKEKMLSYINELAAFKQRTRLCDFIDSWPCRDDRPPPEDGFKQLVVKMKQEWSQCTLQDVESFKKALIHKLFLPEFDMILQKAMEGCVCVAWLISPVIATLLQSLPNTAPEFFKQHKIDAVTIDGEDVYLSPVKSYGSYLRKLYDSEQGAEVIVPPTQTMKLLPFKLARIEKEKLSIVDEFTRGYVRGDMDDVGSYSTNPYKKSPMEFEEVGKLSSHSQQKVILIEGAPGVGKTSFSWEFCRKWGRGEILLGSSLLLLLPLRDNSLKEAKTLSDLFYHPNPELQKAVIDEVTSNEGQGVAIWLDGWDELDHKLRESASVFLNLINGTILPHVTVFVTSRPWACEHLRDKCGQHVEILTSAKDHITHYISKAEAEAQPSSIASKFTDYLSSSPVIRAAMYTPVTAKMSTDVFMWSHHTQVPPPTTMSELYTAFTLKTLVDHLSTHPVYCKQQLNVATFDDLPTDVDKQFQSLCKMAYNGLLHRQQLVFSTSDFSTNVDLLGMMQEVPQLYTTGKTYHFIHLTLQEYLAAVHISQLPTPDQTKMTHKHFSSGHFKMTIRFLAGLTKSVNIPTGKWMVSNNNKLMYFHILFEAKGSSLTTRDMKSDEMIVNSHYSWTPLDYYVTGHAISHSNCSWRLRFYNSFIDDEKFALFCQGYATPGETGCSHCISYANFSDNYITSKSIQSFANIPYHMLPDMKELDLSHNKLDRSACNLLAEVVPSMSSLEELWLSYNPIECGGAVNLIEALCDSGVKQLWLVTTGIGMPDCEALCKLLKASRSLQSLHIDHNNLSTKSVVSIITGLVHNRSITDLDISNSHFSMAILHCLSTFVLNDKSNCTLTFLRLQECCISSEGAVKLEDGLCNNITLQYLNLSKNPIGKHLMGVMALAKVLVENKTLKELRLYDCHISERGACKLADTLHKNSSLKLLNLGHNPIGVKGASSISEMLQHNTSLNELQLRDDSLGKEGVHHLIQSLKHNKTLQELQLPEKYKSETCDDRITWRN